MMDSRGLVSFEQLQQGTKRMTFGFELECIAVYPMELFEDDDRNAQGDTITALSLAFMDRGIKSTGHENIDDEECWDLNFESSYSRYCVKDEGGLYLSTKEREVLPSQLMDHMIQPLEVSSRLLSFESGTWKEELATVLGAFDDLRAKGVRFITNSSTGFHIHVGFGSEIMPLRTAKSVLQLCTGFEDRLDALYSTSRIDENTSTNAPPGRHFNASLAWHFKNNEKTELGSNIFHWLTSIEEASSFEELGNFFRNHIPNCSRKTSGHYSTLNLDNLYAPPYVSQGPDDSESTSEPIGTIEFRQHGGTLDFEAIVAHILLKQTMVSCCHTSTDKEFLQLFAHISNPTFRLSDLIRAIGGSEELLRYHEERRSYVTVQAKDADYQRTIEGLQNGEFDFCPLVKLGAQASVEDHERNNWPAVSNRINAKHQAGAYGQFQTRDFDITGEWDKFVWCNSDNFSADEIATLTRVMVFQQLNGDDIEFDSSPRMSDDEDMEDVESNGGGSVYSTDEMIE
jgi:hypothetical protein